MQVGRGGGLCLGIAHEGGAQVTEQVGAAQQLVDGCGQDRLLDDGRARDEGLVANAPATRLKRALRADGQGGEDQHLSDVDGLVELACRDLAGIPVQQPHIGGGVNDDGLRREGAVRNTPRVRVPQLFPRAIQDLVRDLLTQFRQGSGRRERGEHHDDRVVRRGDRDGFLREDAGAQGLQGRERGALGLCLEGGGDPAADAAQAQVVPHFEEGAGQLLAGVHDDELVGQPGVTPHLVVAVVVGVGAARDGDAHVAQVGGHLGEASARVLGDGPRRQRFGAGVQVGAHDPRGRDADAEECLDEGGSLGSLVVVAHDPA